MIVHGSLVAVHGGAAGWRGVLLTGPSGAGKSDLALRCCDGGWRLVADDRVTLWAASGRLFGKAPAVLSGVVELRGQGFCRLDPLAFAEIVATVRLQSAGERQPEPVAERLAGVSIPAFSISPVEASAPARLRRIVDGLARNL